MNFDSEQIVKKYLVSFHNAFVQGIKQHMTYRVK